MNWKKNTISIIKYLGGLAIGALLLYLALKGISLTSVLQDLRQLNIIWVLISLFIHLASHFFRALRWQQQLNASGYFPKIGNTYASVLITYLVNLAFPRAGEVARCTALYRSEHIPLSVSFGTVLVERLIDLLILLALISLAFLLEYNTILSFFTDLVFAQSGESQQIPIWLWIAGFVLLSLFITGWFFRKKIFQLAITQKFIQFGYSLIRAVLDIQKVKRPLLFIFYTIMIWVCYGLMNYAFFLAMPDIVALDIHLGYLALIVTVMGGIGMAMPVPGGTGPYHVTVEFTFAALMVLPTLEASKQLGISFALINHTSQISLMIVAGMISYIYLWYSRRQAPKHEVEKTQ